MLCGTGDLKPTRKNSESGSSVNAVGAIAIFRRCSRIGRVISGGYSAQRNAGSMIDRREIGASTED